LFTFFDFTVYLVFQINRLLKKGYSFHEKAASIIAGAILVGMVVKILFL